MKRNAILFCFLSFLNLSLVSAQSIDELMLEGEYEKAYLEGEKQLKNDPNNAKLNFKTGLAYFYTDDFRTAIPFFQKALAVDTANYKAINRMAAAYNELGLWQEAIAGYEKTLTIEADNPTALRNLAKIYYRENRFSKALTHYTALERLYPKRSLYSRMVSTCLLKQGNGIEAYPKMLEAYEKDTLDLKTITALANMQIRGGLNNEALRVLNAALKNYPDHPRLNFLSGRAHYQKNHHFRAIPFWEKLLATGDSSYNVITYAGFSYNIARKHEKAIELLQQSYAMDRTSETVVRTLAHSYFETKQYDNALRCKLEHGRIIFPDETNEWYYLFQEAEYYNAAGHHKKAIRKYKAMPVILKAKGNDYYKESYNYIPIARIYDEGLKDKKNAIKYYEKYLKQQGRKTMVNQKTYEEVEFRIKFLKEQLHFERAADK